MEKEIEIALANMMEKQDITLQVLTEVKQNSNRLLEAVSEVNEKATPQVPETLLSKSQIEQQHKEIIHALKQQEEQLKQLKEHMDKQPKTAIHSRTVRFFPEFHSVEHYRLLFKCIPIVLAIILSFILLAKVFNYYFATRHI